MYSLHICDLSVEFTAVDILSYFTNPVHCIEKINRNMIFVKRKHQRLFILIVILTISFLLINWLSDNVLAGEILKIVAPSFYKWQQKGSRIAWFERIAKEKDVPLHVASGWTYLSEDQFNSMFKIYIKITCWGSHLGSLLKAPTFDNKPSLE